MNKLVACSLSCIHREEDRGFFFFLESFGSSSRGHSTKVFQLLQLLSSSGVFRGLCPRHISQSIRFWNFCFWLFLILFYLSFWTWMTTCLVSSLKISPSRFISLIYYSIIYKYIFSFWKMKNHFKKTQKYSTLSNDKHGHVHARNIVPLERLTCFSSKYLV